MQTGEPAPPASSASSPVAGGSRSLGGGPADLVAPGQTVLPPRLARPDHLLTGASALLLVLAIAVGAGFASGQLPGPGPGGPAVVAEPAPVPTPTPSTAQRPAVDPIMERESAFAALMDRRAQALLRRDAAAWMADVDPASTDFAARQTAVLSNLAAVPVASWSYEYAGPGLPPSTDRLAVLGPDAWVARVILVYRLADADTADVRRELNYTVVQRDGRWLLADDTDASSAADIWDLGPVQVVRGTRSLVLGTAPADVLAEVAAQSDEATVRVDAVWGTEWPRWVVVVVPRDQAEMARLLQRPDEAGLDQIAAVTTGEIGLSSGESADRVIINPAGFDRLEALGEDVVLTHEFTHVATRATGSRDVPIWLSEGFADYVGYLDTGLSRRTVATDVLDRVRAGTGPTALPDDVAFDPTQGDIAPAYSGSWLAAELIARTYGEEALVAFYREVAGAAGRPNSTAVDPVDAAFADVLATDQATFVQNWLAYLDELSR